MRRKKTAYCIAKRGLDICASCLGVMALSPLFAFVAVWIKRDSQGPVFFRQERVGRDGTLFRIFKFRTMDHSPAEKGLQITPANDNRVTASGRFLRKYKIDELPQLFNVIRGEMSLVGPRPEVPGYVELYPEDKKDLIFSVRPGITDIASLRYKDEGEILKKAADPEETYIREIMPAKIDLACRYVEEASLALDLRLIFGTLASLMPKRSGTP